MSLQGLGHLGRHRSQAHPVGVAGVDTPEQGIDQPFDDLVTESVTQRRPGVVVEHPGAEAERLLGGS